MDVFDAIFSIIKGKWLGKICFNDNCCLFITLIIVGKHYSEIRDILTDKQKIQENTRPERKKFEEFAKIL